MGESCLQHRLDSLEGLFDLIIGDIELQVDIRPLVQAVEGSRAAFPHGVDKFERFQAADQGGDDLLAGKGGRYSWVVGPLQLECINSVHNCDP